jgi:hypothetical protein
MTEQTTAGQTGTDESAERHYSDLTPYAAAIVLTRKLHQAGKLAADEEIRSQTMYSNKSIKRYGTPRKDGGEGVYFVGDSFAQYLKQQLSGSGATRSSKDYDALSAEFDVDFVEEAVESDEGVESDETAKSFEEVTGQADMSALQDEESDENEAAEDEQDADEDSVEDEEQPA